MTFETIRVSIEGSICYLQFNRPQANNTINRRLVDECREVIARCEESMTALVLSGLPDVFCLGADFETMHQQAQTRGEGKHDPEALYDLWGSLTNGSFLSIAHVHGRTNAGGMGFVSASDIVIADSKATFSLSEMLFGIIPACVLPFLIRRVGFQKANYMTLMTQPVTAQQAMNWGVVDVYGVDSEMLLKTHLLRLRRLQKDSIGRYKRYVSNLLPQVTTLKDMAVTENHNVFSNPTVLGNIYRYVETGRFPWDSDL